MTPELTDRRRQVQSSFSFKWNRLPGFGFQDERQKQFYDDWFSRKLGLPAPEQLPAFLSGRRSFLDVGTGLGAKIDTFCRFNRTAPAVGIDFSESVVPAWQNVRHHANARILRADLFRMPFRKEQFDLIVSDGVLHHPPDTRRAFEALLPFLAPGGLIAIHVYRKMGPAREFCDDLLRAEATRMEPEACWAFSEAFTRFGKALSEMQATVDVPQDLPGLGIPAGRYDLQRLIYDHFFKCFWNPDFKFDENTLVNFDWYHPAHAFRHTPEEVRGWFEAAGLKEIRLLTPNPNGISAIGRKA
ncbi:MAG: hypothetical protein COV76_01590 [Candidatus Omnitrophica bacterium CG11_big_fil_rev_8_21_14_0_20_64_10]|nr:MAG: hypothetical protein COV76_01590 [Candidatus Omnitrophica bacterium CG11_big_fil_rev_8_21_14_0_20_64_10]